MQHQPKLLHYQQDTYRQEGCWRVQLAGGAARQAAGRQGRRVQHPLTLILLT